MPDRFRICCICCCQVLDGIWQFAKTRESRRKCYRVVPARPCMIATSPVGIFSAGQGNPYSHLPFESAMPINIVCPGCKKRFSVSEKFAGKQGPCPKCKTVIEIPALEDEVVIHGPEAAGLKDSKGRAIVEPIMREETAVSTRGIVGIGVFIVVVFGIAFGLRVYDGDVPFFIKLLGAISLAPPLVLGGYTFLRNDELEAFRGKELAIRVLVCSAVYAGLWGVFVFVPWVLGIEFTSYQLAFAVPFVLVGAFSAFASFDLEYMTGILHYGLYVIVTVLIDRKSVV